MTKFDLHSFLFELEIYVDPITIILIVVTSNLIFQMKHSISLKAIQIYGIVSLGLLLTYHFLFPTWILYFTELINRFPSVPIDFEISQIIFTGSCLH